MGVLAVTTGLCYVAIKAGLPYEPPLRFGGLRALIGGLLMLALLSALRRRLIPDANEWRWVVGLGLTSTSIGFGAMFLSPGLAGAGVASVLGNSQPVFALMLAMPLLGERPTRGKLAALVLGMVGVILIALPSISRSDASGLAGSALALLASLSGAVAAVIAKRMGAGVDLLTVSAWQLIIGSVPLLVMSGAAEHGSLLSVDPLFLGILAFLAIAQTAVPTPLWYWLLRGDEVGRLSLFLFAVPVIGALVAVLAFGEAVSALQVAGLTAAVVSTGIAALSSPAARGCACGCSSCLVAPPATVPSVA